MSVLEHKAADLRAPTPSSGALFTVAATHSSNVLPAAWMGQFVTVVSTVDCWFSFSVEAQEIDRTIASTAAGTVDAKLGKKLPASTERHYRLPDRTNQEATLFFNREAGGAGDIEIWLASGT